MNDLEELICGAESDRAGFMETVREPEVWDYDTEAECDPDDADYNDEAESRRYAEMLRQWDEFEWAYEGEGSAAGSDPVEPGAHFPPGERSGGPECV